MKRLLPFFWICLLSSLRVFPQENIQILTNYELYTSSINLIELTNITILNTSTVAQEGKISILVKESGSSIELVQLEANNVKFKSGPNVVPFSSYTVTFSSSPSSQFLQQSNTLRNGVYEICLLLHLNREEVEYKICDVINLLKTFEIHLLSPFDKEVIETLNPHLQWYSSPNEAVEYFIQLTPLTPFRNVEEALSKNIRYLDLSIEDKNYLYPYSARNLEYDKIYVWQVIAVKNNEIIGRSEAWEFTPKEHQGILEEISYCYRQINKNYNSGNYIFHDIIKFAYNNYASEQCLNYSITDTKSGKQIEDVPKIQLSQGINKVDLPIKHLSQLKKGRTYIIEIQNKFNEKYQLSFVVRK